MTDRSYAIQDAESQRVPYRAYTVQHAGLTYTELKAKEARYRRNVLRIAGWLTFVLIAFAFAIHLVLR